MAIANGMYEIRSMLQLNMAVDVAGASTTKGANVQLYGVNDTNAQKFIFTDTGSGYTIQNVSSLMYVDVDGSGTTNGTNVKQWTNNNSRAQRWQVTETGETVTIDSVECPVVSIASYVTAARDMMMDVRSAMTTNKTNIQIYTSNNTLAQRFALYPTTKLDTSFPVPAKAGWAQSFYSNPYYNQGGDTITDMKLGWLMPSTWTPTSTRKYERRIRWRYMDAVTSTYGAWSSWSQWADVDPYVRDVYCYDRNVVDASYDRSVYKAREFQEQVRCKTSAAHGQSVAGTVRVFIDPLPTLTPAGASGEGLLVAVTSDYAPAKYIITSINLGGKELLNEPADVEMLGMQGQLVIPWANLDGLPADDEAATVTYMRGTDMYALFTYPATTTMTFDYGDAPATAPTFTDADGRTLKAEHPDGVIGTWVSNGTGVYGGEGDSVPYPFGGPFEVLVALSNGKMYRTTMQRNVEPVHAFNWDGGSLILECSEAPLVTSRSVSADYEALSLNQRPWQSVHFTETLSSEFAVSGLLYEGLTESTVADVMELMRQHYVIYRAPSGEIADVAVTSASYTTHREYTIVEVNLIQESR